MWRRNVKSNNIELTGSSAGLLVVAEGTKGKVLKILDGMLLYPGKFVSSSIDWFTDVAAAGIVEEVITAGILQVITAGIVDVTIAGSRAQCSRIIRVRCDIDSGGCCHWLCCHKILGAAELLLWG